MGCSNPVETICQRCGVRQLDLVDGQRRNGQVEVAVGEARQGHFTRIQLDPPGSSAGERLDVGPTTGGHEPARADRNCLDRSEARGAGERDDPAQDDRVGRSDGPAQAVASGPATKLASSLPRSPAPSASDRAIRAFGPVRVPARRAPAWTQVTPPPGKA